jgi:predicted nucleic acid-binding protein/HEAT repeat protein
MRTDAASFGRRWWVLVVGVDGPADSSLARLGSAERDARTLADVLADREGSAVPESQISCLTGAEATRDAILAALDTFAGQVTAEDSLLLYFAGHGLGHDASFFLCCADTVLSQLDTTAVGSEDLDRRLRSLAVRGVLVVLDCCESAGFAENAPSTFRALRTGEFRILLAAARADQQSWELGPGDGTLFSRVFIDIVGGRISAGSRSGVVYFADLMRELYDRIAELRETVAQHAPPQDPVYAGAFTKDPLLFVHRGLSLEQIALETARYTPGYVRRRIRRIAGVAAALLSFAAIVYYGWLYNTEYAAVEGERIAIFNGHPTLNAPGLPVRLWTLPYGPDRLQSENGGVPLPLIAPLGRPVLPLVQNRMKREVRAAALLEAGDSAAARSLALDVLADRAAPFQSKLFAQIVLALTGVPADVPVLRRMLEDERRDVRRYAVQSLTRLDAPFLFARLERDLPAGDVWEHDDIVRDLGPPCSQPLAAYLEKVMGIDSNVPSSTDVLNAAMRTGCRLSVAALVTAVRRPSLDEGNEIAGYARYAGLEAPLRMALESVIDDSRDDAFSRERAMATYMLLPGASCRPAFAAYLNHRFEFAQLTAARAMSRLCPGHELQVAFDPAASSIGFILLRSGQRAWSLTFRPGARGSFPLVRPAIQELVRARRPETPRALLLLSQTVEDDMVRQRALESLQTFAIAMQPARTLLDSNNLGVRRAAYELDRLRDPAGTATRLLSRVGGEDMFYNEMLGRLPLAEPVRSRLRGMLTGDPKQRRDAACVLAMQDDVAQVATLAESPDADARKEAAACIPYHVHAAAILQRIEAKVDRRFPLDTIYELRRNVQARTKLQNELAALATPQERLWRLSLIDDEPGPGMATGFRYYVREQRFVLRNGIAAEAQHAASKALLLKAVDGELTAIVPQFVVFEISYVFQAMYGATGERLATLIRAVVTLPGARVTDDCPWKRVLEVWPDPLPALADAAILAIAATNRYDAVATFDKKLAKRLRGAGIRTYW